MDTLLRKLAEWKARRRSAQVIVFDGGAEVEKDKAFLRGAITGIGITFAVFLFAAPRSGDTDLQEELERRERLVRESNRRMAQAVEVAEVCVNTAQNLERTLSAYEAILGTRYRRASSGD